MKIGLERDDLQVTTTLTVLAVYVFTLCAGAVAATYMLYTAVTPEVVYSGGDAPQSYNEAYAFMQPRQVRMIAISVCQMPIRALAPKRDGR